MSISFIKCFIRKLRQAYLHKKFQRVGNGSNIGSTLRIQGGANITIGDMVNVGKFCWLAAVPLTESGKAELTIGDGCQIGDFNHLFATGSIVFEKDVLTANNIYITDNLHEYCDIHTPIMDQPIKQLKPVVIGSGRWIGENVSIIGASIGKNSVIGANSVVTHDIPDYCVAVGAPAKIIKRYDHETKSWVRVYPNT